MRADPRLALVSLLLVATTSALRVGTVSAAPPEPSIDGTHGVDIAANMRVAVHVYSQVGDFAEDDERVALEVAAEVFAEAAVDIAWTRCTPGLCLTPSAETLKLRIALSPDRGEPYSGVLGHALIDSQVRAGVLATVFLDRTRRLARDVGIDSRVLLGRAMAHELAHLLLGTSTHGSGLMREVWSHSELLDRRRNDWVLDPNDAAAIRHRLVRRGSRPPGAS